MAPSREYLSICLSICVIHMWSFFILKAQKYISLAFLRTLKSISSSSDRRSRKPFCLVTDEVNTPGRRAAHLRLAPELLSEQFLGPGDEGVQTRHDLNTCWHFIFCLKNVPHDSLISPLHCWGVATINCNLTLASYHFTGRELAAPNYLPHHLNICFGIVGLVKTRWNNKTSRREKERNVDKTVSRSRYYWHSCYVCELEYYNCLSEEHNLYLHTVFIKQLSDDYHMPLVKTRIVFWLRH